MTDARFPERWLNDRRIMRLEPAAFRAFVLALTWSVANRTDGVIEDDDLGLVPGRVSSDDAAALVAAGLWERRESSWIVSDFETTQSTAAQLAAAEAARAEHRRKERERQRRHRERQRVSSTDAPVTRDGTRDVRGQSTRPGQARPGQAQDRPAATEANDHARVSVWPDVVPVAVPAPDEGVDAAGFCRVCGAELQPFYVEVGRTTHPGCVA